MVMRPEPWGQALDDLVPAATADAWSSRPRPAPFTQQIAEELAAAPWLLFAAAGTRGSTSGWSTTSARMPVEEMCSAITCSTAARSP